MVNIISLLTGEQNTGISPHALTHHLGGTDALSAEDIGAEVEGAVDTHEAIFHIDPSPLLPRTRFDFPTINPVSLALPLATEWQGIAGTTPRVTKVDNLIYLSGIVGGGSNQYFATLPEGYRPAQTTILPIWCKDSSGIYRLGRLQILFWGGLEIGFVRSFLDATNGGWASLDGIKFAWNEPTSFVDSGFEPPIPLPASSQGWNNSSAVIGKIANKFAYVQGQTSCPAGSGTTISVIPLEYRPPLDLIFTSTWSQGSLKVGAIEIKATGEILFKEPVTQNIADLNLTLSYILS